jgi:hypothetical protein
MDIPPADHKENAWPWGIFARKTHGVLRSIPVWQKHGKKMSKK